MSVEVSGVGRGETDGGVSVEVSGVGRGRRLMVVCQWR